MELVRGRCGTCGTSWVGAQRCHCSRCCQTWDDEELFAAHRADGGCSVGRAMGLQQTRNGIWLRPLDQVYAPA